MLLGGAAGIWARHLRRLQLLPVGGMQASTLPPPLPPPLQTGQPARQAFGSKAGGEDEAALLWSPWALTRGAASQPELPPEWTMRQALFAAQSRLLLKLHRHAEVGVAVAAARCVHNGDGVALRPIP